MGGGGEPGGFIFDIGGGGETGGLIVDIGGGGVMQNKKLASLLFIYE